MSEGSTELTIPRVLFVGRTRYRLPLPDGLARKWDALSERMGVRVIASGTGTDPRFRLVPPRPLDGLLFYATLPAVIARELRSFRPDVVVAESPYEAAAAELARTIARSRARVVVEVHGDWRVWSSHYGSRARAFLRPVSDAVAEWAVDHADGHRAVSGFTASLVQGRGREPLGVFTTYSDLGAFSGPRVRVPDERRVLFVGVLERYKNVEGLAAAWRLVTRRVPEAKLHLVGMGTLAEVAEGLAREGVQWDRRLEPEQVAAAFDASRALLLPSASEGLPRIGVESFLRGRGIVGTRAGGIPDLVEDEVSGLLVELGDTEALAGAIERLLTEDGLAEKLGQGAAEAAERWVSTPTEYADRVLAVVTAVLA
jgi:glycosyltransferase involved in cell wall biosynthesis